jgi:hypothetical protein
MAHCNVGSVSLKKFDNKGHTVLVAIFCMVNFLPNFAPHTWNGNSYLATGYRARILKLSRHPFYYHFVLGYWKDFIGMKTIEEHLGHPRVTVACQSNWALFTLGLPLNSSQFCSWSLFPLLSILPPAQIITNYYL